MKTINYLQTTFLLLFTPLCLTAQNWMPILPGETYYFRTEGANYITNTIKVDSVEQIGANTVYHLNRVVREIEDPLEGNQYYNNQGQFLLQKITRTPADVLTLASESVLDPGYLILHPTADPGFSWVADPAANITCTIASVELGAVLGQPDSLKHLMFTNGDEWILSKNHGLVRCPDKLSGLNATLTGLETLHLGDRPYRFDDFFNFEVGTILEYYESSASIFGETDFNYKNTVLERQISQDSARFRVERRWKKTIVDVFSGNSSTTGKDTLWWAVSNSTLRFPWPYNNQYLPYNEAAVGVRSGIFAAVTEQGVFIGPATAACSVFQPSPILESLLDCEPGQQYRETFRPGLGQTALDIEQIDYFFSKRLLGAVVGGDTIWGTVSPDWIFTETNTPAGVSNQIKVFPNPAVSQLEIVFETALNEPAFYQILTPDSRLVGQGRTTGVINLSGIPTGVCMLMLQTEQGIFQSRFVKN